MFGAEEKDGAIVGLVIKLIFIFCLGFGGFLIWILKRENVMPMVDFKFSGTISGAVVNEVFDKDGNIVNVSHLTCYELAHHLDNGTYTIEIAPYMLDCVEREVNTEGFVASRFRPREQ